MKFELQTMTLGDDDNPQMVCCEGHVTATEFNKAFKNEGWADEGDWTDLDLTRGYGRKDSDGFYHFSKNKNHLNIDPYTFVKWD